MFLKKQKGSIPFEMDPWTNIYRPYLEILQVTCLYTLCAFRDMQRGEQRATIVVGSNVIISTFDGIEIERRKETRKLIEISFVGTPCPLKKNMPRRKAGHIHLQRLESGLDDRSRLEDSDLLAQNDRASGMTESVPLTLILNLGYRSFISNGILSVGVELIPNLDLPQFPLEGIDGICDRLRMCDQARNDNFELVPGD